MFVTQVRCLSHKMGCLSYKMGHLSHNMGCLSYKVGRLSHNVGCLSYKVVVTIGEHDQEILIIADKEEHMFDKIF